MKKRKDVSFKQLKGESFGSRSMSIKTTNELDSSFGDIKDKL